MKTLTIILALFTITVIAKEPKKTNKTKVLTTVCLSDDTGNESSEALAVKTITNGVDSVTCYMLIFNPSDNTFVSLTTSNAAKESVTKLKAQLSEADQTKITNFKNSIE